MTTQDKTLSLTEQRSRLERRANVIRSRLLRTIDALDTRRHQVQEMGHHARRLAVPALASVLGVAAVALGTTLAVRALVERRRERSFSYRLSKAIAPFRAPPRPSFWGDALRKLALSAIGIVGTELAKRGAMGLIAARHAEPALPAAPVQSYAVGAREVPKLDGQAPRVLGG